MTGPAPPRPLTDEESGVLGALLALEFPGVEALREQARTVRAAPGCTCGCGTIDLHVPASCARAAVRSRTPVEGTVLGADGEQVGGVLLLVDEGLLSGLEVYPLTDDPLPMPPADRLADLAVDADTSDEGS